MTKAELIAELVAARPYLRVGDVETIVATILEEITATLVAGGRVELRGFGSFIVRQRRSREARNPRTGEAVQIAEKQVPLFKTGKDLRERLNQQSEFLGHKRYPHS